MHLSSPSQRSHLRPLPSLPLSLLLLLGTSHLAAATPYPKDALHDAGYSYLQLRDCDSYCGADNQLCCSGGSVCTTLSGNIATCLGGGGGSGAYLTTTWTETRTYTSTIMTNWEPAPVPTAGVDCIPKNDQQEACGTICCAGWQTCAFQGQCSSRPGYQEPSTIVVTTGGVTTTQYSAPYRITATTTVVNSGAPTETLTETQTDDSPTATSTDGSPEATETSDDSTIGAGGDGGGGGGGLSGGAIAGIVIGSLVGIALIPLILFCCIARGLWNICCGLCCGRKHRDDRSDSYSSDYPQRPHRTGLFGLGGGTSSSGGEKHGGGKRWLGLAGLAAALFAFMNLRGDKKKKPARRPEHSRSRYSDSYYSYSDRRSPRASSSGRRTYQSRRTGDSRRPPPPRSYYSRSRSSRP